MMCKACFHTYAASAWPYLMNTEQPFLVEAFMKSPLIPLYPLLARVVTYKHYSCECCALPIKQLLHISHLTKLKLLKPYSNTIHNL